MILNNSPSRAGFIPFFRLPSGEFEMLFMVSSNPIYGGPDPAIAKGRIEHGRTPKDAGIREAEEELGLRTSNIVSSYYLGWDGLIGGMYDKYRMQIFIGEIADKNAFDTPDFEVSHTVWMTLDEFKKNGRSSHLNIVEACHGVALQRFS